MDARRLRCTLLLLAAPPLLACGDRLASTEPEPTRDAAPSLAVVLGGVTELPGLARGPAAPVLLPASEAFAVDGAGRPVGESEGIWARKAVTFTPLAMLGGVRYDSVARQESIARGTSPNGRYVVGAARDSVGRFLPAVWQDGVGRFLSVPSGIQQTGVALDVNDAGEVVGYVDGSGNPRAAYWDAGGAVALLGGLWSRANAINTRGDVAGYVPGPSNQPRAFVKRRGEPLVLLATPAPVFSGALNYSMAEDINDAGQVAGHASPGFVENYKAAIWEADGTFRYIGTLGGATSRGLGINAGGQIVGESRDAAGVVQAFAWTPGDAAPTPLPRPGIFAGGANSRAEDINDAGVVVGLASSGDRSRRSGLVWTIVPRLLNRAPTAAIAPVATAVEGATVAFAGSGTDPDGDALTHAWDLDDDGAFDDAAGASASRSFADDGDYTVRLRVTDAKGASATTSTTVSVANAAPVVRTIKLDLAVLNRPKVGQSFPIAFVWKDTGLLDAAWTYTIAWGDGTTTEGTTASQTQIDASHVYEAAGARTARVTIRDKDGGTATRAFVVEVQP